MYSTGRDGGQGKLGGLTGLIAEAMPDERTPSLVAHFPDPSWDEATSKVAFDRLMQRLQQRALMRARLTRAAVATGVAALATAAWVVL